MFTPVVWLAALQADIGQRRLSNKGMVRAAQGGPLRPHQPQGRGRLQQGKARTAVWLSPGLGPTSQAPAQAPRFRELYVQW